MIKPLEFYLNYAGLSTLLTHKKIIRIEKENLNKIKYMIMNCKRQTQKMINRTLVEN